MAPPPEPEVEPEIEDARPAKSDAAFRTISEVADDLNVPQHVLRFWETKFSQIRPMKRGGGRRYYRPEDIALLKKIRALLYTDGMTIRGVQKLLKESGSKTAAIPAETPVAAPVAVQDSVVQPDLTQILADLISMRDEMRAALR